MKRVDVMITFRLINKININTLHDDLANSDLLMKPKSTLGVLVNQYNETLSKLLDKHAPKQTKSVQVRPPSPWMSNDIIVAKRRRRYLERIWRQRQCQDKYFYIKFYTSTAMP